MKGYKYPEYNKKYRQEHKAESLRATREWAEAHPKEVRAFAREYYYEYREEIKQKRKELKEFVLTHYGNDKLACVHCGESRLACLSIDHIKGRGKEHRRMVGSHMYLWLKSNDFPEGYQTLCMNCQFIKREENKEMKPPIGWRK